MAVAILVFAIGLINVFTGGPFLLSCLCGIASGYLAATAHSKADV